MTKASQEKLTCTKGCAFPVVAGIPRFVQHGGYAAAFGRQWKAWRRTQLDSVSGLRLSRERLQRCLGGDLRIVTDRMVLEAGCGMGRFTEILLDEGARVVAFDLSDAVEASYENIGDRSDYCCFQADVRNPPLVRRSFELILCLGVIQHTPSPEETIRALAEQVRPGGLLVIDHYAPHDTWNYQSHRTLPRRLVRGLAVRLPSTISFALIRLLSRLLIPVHRFLRPPNRFRGQGRLRMWLHRISPVMDYYETLPQLSVRNVEIWMTLDTHDALTDRYKHHRTVEQIRDALTSAGLVVEAVEYGGNGVEARARRSR